MAGLELREDWLSQTREEILEPERAIVDPHFHFFAENEIFPNYRLGGSAARHRRAPRRTSGLHGMRRRVSAGRPRASGAGR